jgi:hypothetical protein
MVAVVFCEDLVVTEYVDCRRRSFLEVNSPDLGRNGKRLLGVPECLAFHIKTKSRRKYISIEVTVCRVSEPPKRRILLPKITALAPYL